MRLPKESEYPKKIHLRGDTYRVKFVKGLKSQGDTDSGKNLIRIRSGMSRNELFRTFIHELFHVLEFSWPIKIPHWMVYKLEKATFQLLLDNFL